MSENLELFESFRWNERVATLVQHLIASLMISLAVVTFVRVGEWLLQDWEGDYLVIAAFIVSLEAMLSYRYVVRERLGVLSREWALYRLAEWVVILLFLKIWIYLIRGFEGVWRDILSWGDQFLYNFFSGEYLFSGIAMFIVWVIASRFSEYFADLEGDEKILKYERESGLSHERAVVRRKLVSMIFTIGGVLVVVTAILRGNWQFVWSELPQLRAGVYNILAFFILGLILLSLTQFSILRARWGLDQIQISRGLAWRWLGYSFLFLSLVVIVSAALPTNYSLGFLNLFGYLVRILVFLTQAFVVFLLLLLYPLWQLLAWILGRPAPQSDRPELPQLPPPPIPGQSPPWLELLKSIIFWVIFVGAIGYALVLYLRSHREQLAFIKRLPFVKWVQTFWDWLGSALAGVDRQISDAVRAGVDRIRMQISAQRLRRGWNLVNLNRLSPRERVQFFYLAMVRRGSESGVPRRSSQTPNEYSSSLIDALTTRGQIKPVDIGQDDGAAEEEILGLTERFVEARYSQHEVTEDQVTIVREYWQRIKRALRRWRRS